MRQQPIKKSEELQVQTILEEAERGDFSQIGSWLSQDNAVSGLLSRLLHEASAHDAVDAVRLLLKAGSNPYDTDEKGRTAFNRAASNGLRALHILTEEAFHDTQRSPDRRRWENYGLNTPSGYYGSTLITYAAKVSPDSLVKDMIEAGADITIINGSGWTLLHCAAVMPDRKDVLKTLVQTFHAQGYEAMIGARTTHTYETDYNGHPVIYEAGLTAMELCQARMKQDPQCPETLAEYPPCLL